MGKKDTKKGKKKGDGEQALLAAEPDTPSTDPLSPTALAMKTQRKKDAKNERKEHERERDAVDKKRESVARALVKELRSKDKEDPMKICVMIRVRRLFEVSLSTESFKVMIHVITCWSCDGDAIGDAVPEEEKKELLDDSPSDDFVYDADPDEAFWEPKWRPRIAIRNLHDGAATLDGSDGEDYFYRSLVEDKTICTWEVEKLCEIGSLFDLLYYPVDVQALDICLELKTSVRETVFIPFPNAATFADCPAGEVAQVMTAGIVLPDYQCIPRHEFTALLYSTDPEQSWTGEQFSGVKCSVWFQRRHENDLYNIAMVQCALTSLVAGVWTLDAEDVEERVANDFTLVLAGVAMKFVVAQVLPPVSYVTLLEKYINITFMFLTLATTAHCMQRQIEGVVSDSQLLIGWTVAWVATNVYCYYKLYSIKHREIDLVRQLNLKKAEGALGSGNSQKGFDTHANVGMGGITDVRVLLDRQKIVSEEKAKEEKARLEKEATKEIEAEMRQSMMKDSGNGAIDEKELEEELSSKSGQMKIKLRARKKLNDLDDEREEIRRLQEAFDEVDMRHGGDHDGRLEEFEMKELIEDLDRKLSDADFKQAMVDMRGDDPDPDISWDQFEAWWFRGVKKKSGFDNPLHAAEEESTDSDDDGDVVGND
eukprot:COSAG06_NODE_4095_length_4581_cov_5.947345_1_plen_652_part_00